MKEKYEKLFGRKLEDRKANPTNETSFYNYGVKKMP